MPIYIKNARAYPRSQYQIIGAPMQKIRTRDLNPKLLSNLVMRHMKNEDITQSDAAHRMNPPVDQSSISRIARGLRSEDELRRLADAIDLPEYVTDELYPAIEGRVDIPEDNDTVSANAVIVTRREVESGTRWRRSKNPVHDTIPLFSRAQAGECNRIVLGEYYGDRTSRMPYQTDDDAYAVRVSGDSMYPRFRDGDTVYVDPNASVSRGDDCIVQLKNEYGEPSYCIIKEFVSKSDGNIKLKQYTPEKTFEIPENEIFAMHFVVGSRR